MNRVALRAFRPVELIHVDHPAPVYAFSAPSVIARHNRLTTRTPHRLLAPDLPKLALRDNYVSCYDYHAIIINDKRDFAGNTRAYRAGCRRKSHKTAHKRRTTVFKAREHKQKKTAQRAKIKPPRAVRVFDLLL